jgi:hypothetical protein
MTLDEIKALPVADLSNHSGQDAHLYLWTIDQHLEASFSVARAWGFRHSATLVWCKPPYGVGLGGTFPSDIEFVLFCRRPGDIDRHGAITVTRWLRDQLKTKGISRRELMQRGSYTEGQIVHWLAGTETVHPGVPSWNEWQRLKALIGFGDEIDEVVRQINDQKGSLPRKRLSRASGRWHEWPRGPHSAKPEAFLDMVEAVSPGPYLEMFARRQRLGWDTWGDEALEHVRIGAG